MATLQGLIHLEEEALEAAVIHLEDQVFVHQAAVTEVQAALVEALTVGVLEEIITVDLEIITGQIITEDQDIEAQVTEEVLHLVVEDAFHQ